LVGIMREKRIPIFDVLEVNIFTYIQSFQQLGGFPYRREN
jgi:hypothetical protein